MARRARVAPVEVEEDEDEDEELESTTLAQVEAEDELAGFLRELAPDASRISCKVARVLRPEDEGVVSAGYVGRLPKPGKSINPDTLEDELRTLAEGGGSFDLEFSVGGKYVKGGRRRINLAGPAKPDRSPEPTPIAQPLPVIAALEAKIAAMEAKDRAVIEEIKTASAIKAAVAPLEAALAAIASRVSTATAGPPVKSLAEQYLERRLLSDEPKSDPQMTALLAKIEGLEKAALAAKEDSAKRERETLDAKIAALEAKLAEPAKVAAPSPRVAAQEMFAPIAEAIAVATLMRGASDVAEETEDTGLADLLAEFKGPIFSMLKKGAKQVAKQVAPMLEQAQTAATTPKAPDPAPTPATFQEWSVLLLTSDKAMTLVQDVEWVRASLKAYRPSVEACAKITTKAGLLEFVRATLGELAEGEVKTALAADPKNEAQALTMIAVLAQTIKKADTAPAPAPVQGVVDEEEDE